MPRGHFGAVTPKRELWPPKRVRIVPQKKATGPTPLGCICDQDLFVLFLVFTPKCEVKIRTKEGFCAPKAKIVPKKKATGPTPRRCICDKDLFFGLHPRIYFFAQPKFSMLPSSPAHYSGARSTSMNRSEIRLKIVFLEDQNITSISTVCLGLGEDLFLFLWKLPHFQSCLPTDKLLGEFSFL